MSVVHSRLLYGAQVWEEGACRLQKNRDQLLQAQRCAALRVARCYRTVSDMAALVLARMPPVLIMAADRRSVAEVRRSGVERSRQVSTQEMVQQWQGLWNSTTKAAWTRRLLPNIGRWWFFGPRQISYHMAQALTGHGCFQSYLSSKGKVVSAECVHCPADNDDAEHTLFHCQLWEPKRRDLVIAVGRNIVLEDVEYLLCGPEREQIPEDHNLRRLIAAATKHGELFHQMVDDILGEKEVLERERQRAARTGV